MAKVLVVAAHPDDEILGCGGTMEKHRRDGDEVQVLFMGTGRDTLGDNQFDATPLLNWIGRVEGELAKYPADIIYTHFRNDLNIDHRITFQAVLTAARPGVSKVKAVYSFEVLSSTEWSFPASFSPDYFVDIEETVEWKLNAMCRLYMSELRGWPHPRSLVGIKHLAAYRGMQAGMDCAEAFETVRRVW